MPVPIKIILIFSYIGIILNNCYELKITIQLILRASTISISNLSRLKFLELSENLFLMSLLAISGHFKLSHYNMKTFTFSSVPVRTHLEYIIFCAIPIHRNLSPWRKTIVSEKSITFPSHLTQQPPL